ncbi:MAG: hypothetical protein JWL60_1291, partial [Gemmatimonadetes bacterium]|nr:hypothetical protein [Gemmatimonadota bacterium]
EAGNGEQGGELEGSNGGFRDLP